MVNSLYDGNVILSNPQQREVFRNPSLVNVSQEQLYAPGRYSLLNQGPQGQNYDRAYPRQRALNYYQPYQQQKEKYGFARFIGKLVLITAAVCGSAVCARKFIPAIKKVNLTEQLPKEAKFKEKVKYKIAKFGNTIIEGFKDLFTKTKKEPSS